MLGASLCYGRGVSQNMTRTIIAVLALSVGAVAQVQINDYVLPTSAPDIAAFNQYVLPNITGITVPVSWAAVDACSGTGPCASTGLYSWAAIENQLADYTTATTGTCYTGGPTKPCLCAGGKACKINLEVNAVTGFNSNNSTPPYVLNVGLSSWATTCPAIGNVPACNGSTPPVDVCFCGGYQGTGSPPPTNTCVNASSSSFNATGVAASWETPFQSAYLGFIKQLIIRYSSGVNGVSWFSQVGYIRLGMGTGGGGVIPCSSEETGMTGTPPTPPLSLSIWGAFAANLFSYAQSQNPPMTMESSGYGGEDNIITLAWSDAIAQNSIPYGAGFGAESLAFHDMVLYSEGMPCSNDWCNIFNSYFGLTPILGMQPISGTSDAYCNSDPGAFASCSLVYILPFAIQRHANVFEIGTVNLLCAYYSAYSHAGCTQSAPGNGFAAALAAAAQGQPVSTSATTGTATISGTTSLQ